MELTEKQKDRIKKAQEHGLTYERLFTLAYAMHLQIFNMSGGNEKEIYDKIGLTDEENALFGYAFLNQEIPMKDLPEDVQEHIKNLIADINKKEQN